MAKQLGIQCANADAALAETVLRGVDEVECVRTSLVGGALTVIDRAVVGPDVVVVERAPVVIPVGRVGWIPLRSPDKIDDLAVKREQRRSLLEAMRRQVAPIAEAEDAGQLDAGWFVPRPLSGTR